MEDLKAVSHSECKMIEANSSECMNNDVSFLTDEKFDFDFLLSPVSENEDEVFIGPIGHKEKCIAVSLESPEGSADKISPSLLDKATWSPLAAEKFVEIFKEAHLIAVQLQSASKTKRNNTDQQEERKTETVEKFVQESKSKLKILERGIVMDKSPKSIKRDTYSVGESPISQRPPSFQKCSWHPVRPTEDSHCPQRLLNASSPRQLDKLSKASIMYLSQSRSDKNIKKPSTFQNAKKTSNSESSNNVIVGQPKQGKLSSSSSRNNQNSMGSSEDLLSDKSGVASDGELFSNSSSTQENQTLPTPSKLMVKTRQLKPSGSIRMRRITSSSSSSSVSSMNSSFNSSISLSPKKGKVQTSGVVSKAFANRSSLSIAPSKISGVRPAKMAVVKTSHIDTSGNPQKAASDNKGKPSVSAPKCKAAVTCDSSGSGIQKGVSDPNQTLVRKSMLGNIRASSSPKLKTKTASSVSMEEMSSKNVAARALQPVRLLSCGSIGSNVAVTPPLKSSEEGIVLKTCSAAKSGLRTPASSIRLSSLPTPAGRRISGIPTLTPQTIPRSVSSPNVGPLRQVSSVSSKKPLATSSKWAKDSKTRMTTSSSSSTEGDSSPSQIIPIALDFSPEKSSEEMEQKVTKAEEPAKESLLVDIGLDKTPIGVDKIVIQRCENKPLIDLFNTPEIIKAAPVKPTGQLIDLSSPLIQLGPEGNKENVDSPLLKF
ncbi:G2 and S phase-expressed protein 1 isoform X2 [Sceloporus undulatus]|nr:G2 and S phase-expressed protein 1 isoform X2 [Sceloporus undulatus]XP_042326588.1 G2 and S phase-expressed protein 1 isoform X2 [Sceloporus undulatus]